MSGLEIKIDKGIPVPRPKGRTKLVGLDISLLCVGDSIKFENPKECNSLIMSFKKYCKQNNLDWKYATRIDGSGKRFWRIS